MPRGVQKGTGAVSRGMHEGDAISGMEELVQGYRMYRGVSGGTVHREAQRSVHRGMGAWRGMWRGMQRVSRGVYGRVCRGCTVCCVYGCMEGCTD